MIGVEQTDQFYVDILGISLELFTGSVLRELDWPGDSDDSHKPFLETFGITVIKF